MPSFDVKEPYVKRSISLPLRQLRGLRLASKDDGHGNVSRIVQDLIEAELRSRYGRDWAEQVDLSERIPQASAAA